MRETAMVFGLLLLFGAIGAAQAVPWQTLLQLGYGIMLPAAAVGIPAEVVYFAALGLCLRHNGMTPPGWYWRSFDHHHLLSPTQRRWVLPPFYLGALSFLVIVLGIGVTLLSLVALVVQG